MEFIKLIWDFLNPAQEVTAAIPLAIPLIMAGVGAATKGLAAHKGGKEMNKYEASLNKEEAEMDAWYNVEKNRDFMESDIARAAMNKVLENIEDRNKVADSTADITGASDASRIAMKAKNQEAFGNVAKDLASMGTMRRDRIEDRRLSNMSRMAGMRRDLFSGRAQNAAQLGAMGGDLIGAGASLLGETSLADAGTDVFDDNIIAGADPTQIA